MKALPDEGQVSKQQTLSKNRISGARSSGKNSQKLARYRVEVKQLSKRINAYADGGFAADIEVMTLLNETRDKIVKFHVARNALRGSSKSPSPKRRRRK